MGVEATGGEGEEEGGEVKENLESETNREVI